MFFVNYCQLFVFLFVMCYIFFLPSYFIRFFLCCLFWLCESWLYWSFVMVDSFFLSHCCCFSSSFSMSWFFLPIFFFLPHFVILHRECFILYKIKHYWLYDILHDYSNLPTMSSGRKFYMWTLTLLIRSHPLISWLFSLRDKRILKSVDTDWRRVSQYLILIYNKNLHRLTL